MVGLYASFCIAIVTAFAGGRPGMISAATGAMALLVGSLVLNHGIEYYSQPLCWRESCKFLWGC